MWTSGKHTDPIDSILRETKVLKLPQYCLGHILCLFYQLTFNQSLQYILLPRILQYHSFVKAKPVSYSIGVSVLVFKVWTSSFSLGILWSQDLMPWVDPQTQPLWTNHMTNWFVYTSDWEALYLRLFFKRVPKY